MGSIWRAPASRFAQRRAENEREHRRRVDDAYRRVPGLRALDQTLQQQMITLVGLTMRHGSDPTDELRALERANLDTQAQRAELLTAYRLPVDYTDDLYDCPHCHDTGYVQGQPCECLLRRYNAELTRDLSRLLQHGDESFEHFDLTLYDERAAEDGARVSGLPHVCADVPPRDDEPAAAGRHGAGQDIPVGVHRARRRGRGLRRRLRDGRERARRVRVRKSSSAAAPTARPPRSAWSSISAAT